MNKSYVDTVRLLLAIAPAVFQSPRFAMKGGTAINLFVQSMPRLSVDIDVVFVDHTIGRNDALAHISADLAEAKKAIEAMGFTAALPKSSSGDEVKLIVQNPAAQVKVEVNFVFRGTVLPPTHAPLAAIASELFTTELSVPMLQPDELYGSKLVAAMDRQHPRDIFDVMMMIKMINRRADGSGVAGPGVGGKGIGGAGIGGGGISGTVFENNNREWPPAILDCFVAYIAGHNRPVHEVLFPRTLSLEPTFANEFVGMTRDPVELNVLQETQRQLIATLPGRLTKGQRDFLLSLVKGEPAWELMPFKHLKDMPAIQWKLLNLEKLKSKKPEVFRSQFEILNEKLRV